MHVHVDIIGSSCSIRSTCRMTLVYGNHRNENITDEQKLYIRIIYIMYYFFPPQRCVSVCNRCRRGHNEFTAVIQREIRFL